MSDDLRAKAGLRVKVANRFLIFGLVSLFLVSASVFSAEKNYDQRIAQLERTLKNQNLLKLMIQLEELQREVGGLRGEIELLTHNLGEVRQQQKDIYIDLDQRMIDLDAKLLSGVASSPLLVGGEFDGDASAQQVLTEQEGYQSALAILKKGRYEEAIEAFQAYLNAYPMSEYAANAQYWMAEAYYVLKDYQTAIAQFKKVTVAYPDSRKVPDAYLKIGFSFYEIKDWRNARVALERIVSDYGSATAARLAKRRLQKMRQEGRG